MDLTFVYAFIVAIVAVLSYGIHTIQERNIRTVMLAMLLAVVAVGVYMERIKAQHDLSKANAQIISLAKCQGTDTICGWETK